MQTSCQKHKRLYSTLLREYENTRLQLAEARLHIDKLRFGRNVDIQGNYIIRHYSEGDYGNSTGPVMPLLCSSQSDKCFISPSLTHSPSTTPNSPVSACCQQEDNDSDHELHPSNDQELHSSNDTLRAVPLHRTDRGIQYSVASLPSYNDTDIVADMNMFAPHNGRSVSLSDVRLLKNDKSFGKLRHPEFSIISSDVSHEDRKCRSILHQATAGTEDIEGNSAIRTDSKQHRKVFSDPLLLGCDSSTNNGSTTLHRCRPSVTSKHLTGEVEQNYQTIPSLTSEDGRMWLNEDLSSSSLTNISFRNIHMLRQQILKLMENIQNNEESIEYLYNKLVNIQQEHAQLARYVCQIMEGKDNNSKASLQNQFASMVDDLSELSKRLNQRVGEDKHDTNTRQIVNNNNTHHNHSNNNTAPSDKETTNSLPRSNTLPDGQQRPLGSNSSINPNPKSIVQLHSSYFNRSGDVSYDKTSSTSFESSDFPTMMTIVQSNAHHGRQQENSSNSGSQSELHVSSLFNHMNQNSNKSHRNTHNTPGSNANTSTTTQNPSRGIRENNPSAKSIVAITGDTLEESSCSSSQYNDHQLDEYQSTIENDPIPDGREMKYQSKQHPQRGHVHSQHGNREGIDYSAVSNSVYDRSLTDSNSQTSLVYSYLCDDTATHGHHCQGSTYNNQGHSSTFTKNHIVPDNSHHSCQKINHSRKKNSHNGKLVNKEMNNHDIFLQHDGNNETVDSVGMNGPISAKHYRRPSQIPRWTGVPKHNKNKQLSNSNQHCQQSNDDPAQVQNRYNQQPLLNGASQNTTNSHSSLSISSDQSASHNRYQHRTIHSPTMSPIANSQYSIPHQHNHQLPIPNNQSTNQSHLPHQHLNHHNQSSTCDQADHSLLSNMCHQSVNNPSISHQLPNQPHQLPNQSSIPHQLPNQPHQLPNQSSISHQLPNQSSISHQLPNQPHQLPNQSSIPHQLPNQSSISHQLPNQLHQLPNQSSTYDHSSITQSYIPNEQFMIYKDASNGQYFPVPPGLDEHECAYSDQPHYGVNSSSAIQYPTNRPGHIPMPAEVHSIYPASSNIEQTIEKPYHIGLDNGLQRTVFPISSIQYSNNFNSNLEQGHPIHYLPLHPSAGNDHMIVHDNHMMPPHSNHIAPQNNQNKFNPNCSTYDSNMLNIHPNQLHSSSPLPVGQISTGYYSTSTPTSTYPTTSMANQLNTTRPARVNQTNDHSIGIRKMTPLNDRSSAMQHSQTPQVQTVSFVGDIHNNPNIKSVQHQNGGDTEHINNSSSAQNNHHFVDTSDSGLDYRHQRRQDITNTVNDTSDDSLPARRNSHSKRKAIHRTRLPLSSSSNSCMNEDYIPHHKQQHYSNNGHQSKATTKQHYFNECNGRLSEKQNGNQNNSSNIQRLSSKSPFVNNYHSKRVIDKHASFQKPPCNREQSHCDKRRPTESHSSCHQTRLPVEGHLDLIYHTDKPFHSCQKHTLSNTGCNCQPPHDNVLEWKSNPSHCSQMDDMDRKSYYHSEILTLATKLKQRSDNMNEILTQETAISLY